MADNVL